MSEQPRLGPGGGEPVEGEVLEPGTYDRVQVERVERFVREGVARDLEELEMRALFGLPPRPRPRQDYRP